MSLWKFAIALSLTVPFFGAETTLPERPSLIAHEWGTFTSVAGRSGGPEYWTALSGPSDLPCFVNRLPGFAVKSWASSAPAPGVPWTVTSSSATVRMETPVLYFYAPRKMTLSVRVDFPQGLITEWYPKAAKIQPETSTPAVANGRIDWGPVEVLPGEQVQLPSSQGPSHYYAARNTDAAPIRIGNQQEKLIFYRGIGRFGVPVWARFTDDRTLEIRNTGPAIPAAIVFEHRGVKSGYRILHPLVGTQRVETPELTGDLDLLRARLADTLVELGLYRKEALAMIETWRDSWFEEGMRVIYTVPRAMVDQVLPLAISPDPAAVSRVFVGRVEVMSPAVEQTLRAALTAGDVPVLAKFGRFLQPFLAQMGQVEESPAARNFIEARYQESQREFYAPSCRQ